MVDFSVGPRVQVLGFKAFRKEVQVLFMVGAMRKAGLYLRIHGQYKGGWAQDSYPYL